MYICVYGASQGECRVSVVWPTSGTRPLAHASEPCKGLLYAVPKHVKDPAPTYASTFQFLALAWGLTPLFPKALFLAMPAFRPLVLELGWGKGRLVLRRSASCFWARAHQHLGPLGVERLK